MHISIFLFISALSLSYNSWRISSSKLSYESKRKLDCGANVAVFLIFYKFFSSSRNCDVKISNYLIFVCVCTQFVQLCSSYALWNSCSFYFWYWSSLVSVYLCKRVTTLTKLFILTSMPSTRSYNLPTMFPMRPSPSICWGELPFGITFPRERLFDVYFFCSYWWR